MRFFVLDFGVYPFSLPHTASHARDQPVTEPPSLSPLPPSSSLPLPHSLPFRVLPPSFPSLSLLLSSLSLTALASTQQTLDPDL
eukprot:3941292-Rhodomonas_salina.5